MCGIIGYIGERNAVPIIIEGLKRMEYRGYDSSGLAVLDKSKLAVFKKAGFIAALEEHVPNNLSSKIGIGHTRWATHGGATDINAHPHFDCSGKIAVVHNGIIENFQALKSQLISEGHQFSSETDTEVIAHLIEKFYEGDLEKAVQKTIQIIRGTYGIAVMHAGEPGTIIGARNGSPLLVGLGDNENFIASDVTAILSHTKQVIYMEDHEIIKLTSSTFRTSNLTQTDVQKDIQEVEIGLDEIEKGKYDHFMQKEIFEQPDSIERAFTGRLLPDEGTAKLGGLNLNRQELFNIEHIKIVGCGTSYHAGLIGAYCIEKLARIPVSVEIASELRFKNPIIEKNTLFFAVSQSGETMDTLFAMREIQRKGGKMLGICNVVGSTIPRESDGGVYVHSGPEIAVASTKAFTSQVVVFYLIALMLARMRDISLDAGKNIITDLLAIPEKVRKFLENTEDIKKIATKYSKADSLLVLGRGISYPVALEGALKLTEVSYIHAQGLPAAEIKHGLIALIDENKPVIVIIPKDELYEKNLSTIQEIKARKGKVVAICNEREDKLAALCEDLIVVPKVDNVFSPLVTVIPLQLLSYYMADYLKLNVDKPRNLAKSVTVE